MPASISSNEVRNALRAAAQPSSVNVSVDGSVASIPTPFPSPADWRDQWIYFLMVDRFNNPERPPHHSPFDGDHNRFQGGKLEGVRQQLGYLADLGVGAVWLSPVFKNCQHQDSTYHGYGFSDLLEVEPRFTSDPARARTDTNFADAEFRALVDDAHARGIYVICDIVLNHAGDVFDYDGFGSEAPHAQQPYPIHWRDADGTPAFDSFENAPSPLSRDAAVWPAELQKDQYFRRQGVGGEAGGDFASLKELVTGFRQSVPLGSQLPVRDALIRAYQYLIARFDIDGFRIDTLKFIEPDFARTFANAMREFALSIGKRDFFTFGEVFDNEEKIARFIGRNVVQTGEPIGVDAALDFPLFFKLPSVVKGFTAPSSLSELYTHRTQVQRNLITSHGEASSHFVTFMDNHDMHERFYFDDGTARFDDQATLGFATLFALQGIPCLYYGTEQGLSGRGDNDRAVREALWGKPGAFDRTHPFYESIRGVAKVRSEQPALRYGRQYFRPISGNGVDFGISPFAPGVIAFSRILNDHEVVVVANATSGSFDGEVIVDATLNDDGVTYGVLFSNRPSPTAPAPVRTHGGGSVRVVESSGAVTTGPLRALPVKLQPFEIQITRRNVV